MKREVLRKSLGHGPQIEVGLMVAVILYITYVRYPEKHAF